MVSGFSLGENDFREAPAAEPVGIDACEAEVFFPGGINMFCGGGGFHPAVGNLIEYLAKVHGGEDGKREGMRQGKWLGIRIFFTC